MGDFLTGQTRRHIVDLPEGIGIHRDALNAFKRLQEKASVQGFDLQVLSGFRSFKDQLSIWNRKAEGQRAVLDTQSRPIDISTLTPSQLVFSILRWSALPGASRHHWGTDLDVFDAAARPEGYDIELIPDEVNPGGMFGKLHLWLDDVIARGESCGFFRPYAHDLGGVAVERWHLSYFPLADDFLNALSLERLSETLRHQPLALKDTVLENLDSIYTTFVTNISGGTGHATT